MPASRGKWTPNDKDLEIAKTLAAYGVAEEKIAALLGVSKSTFHRAVNARKSALRDTMGQGRATAGSKVCQKAFEMATSGKSPSMTQWWLQVREGWKVPQQIEISGPAGGPIETSEEDGNKKTKRLEEKIAKLKLMLQG